MDENGRFENGCQDGLKKAGVLSAGLLLFKASVGIDAVFHAITGTLDEYRFAMMDQAVQDGRGEGCVIVEDGTPLFKRLVGCDADGAVFVASADDLE